MSGTMTVTVRDRHAEAPWGSGPTNPVTREVTISDRCPRCGGPRGEPSGLNSCEDGAWYWVQTWQNPCGHIDLYDEVILEAKARAAAMPPADVMVEAILDVLAPRLDVPPELGGGTCRVPVIRLLADGTPFAPDDEALTALARTIAEKIRTAS